MKTLEEILLGHSPNLKNLRIFSCVAYAHMRQGKHDARVVKLMFLGYPKGVKYSVLISDSRSVTLARKLSSIRLRLLISQIL